MTTESWLLIGSISADIANQYPSFAVKLSPNLEDSGFKAGFKHGITLPLDKAASEFGATPGASGFEAGTWHNITLPLDKAACGFKAILGPFGFKAGTWHDIKLLLGKAAFGFKAMTRKITFG